VGLVPGFSQAVVAALSVDVMKLGWAHQAMGQAFFTVDLVYPLFS
jgi:hypothetical protein